MKAINTNMNYPDDKIDDFDFLTPDSELVFYDNEHGFCINTQDVMDYIKKAVTERVEEVKKLSDFHSYEVPIEYGDGTQTTEKMCPMYELDGILNRVFNVFEKDNA